MTSVLTECANNIVGRLINLILSEAHKVCCFNCIVDDFEKEKPELEAKWRTISRDVEDARTRAEDIRNDVTHWQVEAEKLINEDTKTKMSCFGGWCPNCIWRYHRGKELAGKTNDIRTLVKESQDFIRVGHDPRLTGIESHSSQDFIHFESRDSTFTQLLDAIEDENNYITGLYGMGGAGKTRLAKEVGRKLQESRKFVHVVFTTVSNAPDINKIQDTIAVSLGLKLNDKNASERRSMLWHSLTNGEKNILIILDDVWGRISFEEIGIPSEGSHRNCRVLLTSRKKYVCIQMGCQRPIQLGHLSDEDGWLLFKSHVGIDDSFPNNFQEKGKQIINKCKNLPVAIVVIARTLKNQPLEEWDVALEALQNPMPMLNDDEELSEIYKCLKHSYDNLKNVQAERLFLLLSVFPEDAEVPTEYIARFGIGVGLFGEVNKYFEARGKALRVKNKLIDSCLWLKAENGGVKLHDLVREVALWIDKGIQFVMLSEKERKALAEKEKKVQYLYCDDTQVKDMDVFPSWFDGSELEFLTISIKASASVEVPNACFEKMTKLRVLYLKHVSWLKHDLTLPVSLHPLTNVRSLILNGWKLGDISILKYLRSLETLDLDYCLISELPNEIAKLEKLILLSMRGCEIERNNPFEVIERCLQLQELYFVGNEFQIPDTVDEVEVIHQNTILPLTLNRYHLLEDDEMIDSISKIVCLPNIDGLISKATFKNLVQGGEVVKLDGIEGEWRNLIPEIVPMEDNSMKDLLELRLKSCSMVQCLINTTHSRSHVSKVFSNLVELGLYCMDNLEELCIGHLPFEFLKSLQRLSLKWCDNLQGMLFKNKLNLCNLKIMELDGCPMLSSLFELSTARSLIVLEELKIRKCQQVTDIITGEASKDPKEKRLDGDNDHTGYDPVFPKLKILEIRECGLLECILPVLFPRDVPLLETIIIFDCGALKHIFGRYQHDHDVVLGSLQKMELAWLPNFMSFSLECYPLISSLSAKSSFSRNCSKTKQQDLNNQKIFSWSCICCYCKKYGPNLRSAKSIKMPVVSKVGQTDCSIPSASSSECVQTFSITQSIWGYSLNLFNIRDMSFSHCPKIIPMFTFSVASKLLVEKLTIDGCDGLKHVIIDTRDDEDHKVCNSIFPKLKELTIWHCDKLEYVIGPNHHGKHNHNLECYVDLPAVEQLILERLQEMINICPKSYIVTCPSLNKFRLDKCPQFNSG